ERKLERMRVVVVDDNADAAAMLETLLRLSSQEVHTAHDGPSALEIVEKTKPDVVLLDIGIPGMDGFEIARRLRRTPAGKKAYLAALTDYTQEQHLAAAREAGFDQQLTKPVDIEVLNQLIERVARERRPPR